MTAEKYLEKIENVTMLTAYTNGGKTYYFKDFAKLMEEYHQAKLKILGIADVVKSLRDEMAIGFAQTKMQVWDGELTNKHREEMLEDWIRRNGDDLTIAEHIVKDAYFLSDEMLKHR